MVEPTELLRVRDLCRYYRQSSLPWRRAGRVHAADGVSFDIDRGQAFGLVGESGSGKSTVARCVLRLEKPDSGSIVLDGTDITRLSDSRLRPLRRQVQTVFQDPASSLNPRWQIADIVAEPLHSFGYDKPARDRRVHEVIDLVGLSRGRLHAYPHQLSGGQQQRVAIARALTLNPALIVADEPLSALDVSIQAQVLNLLLDLKRDFGIAYLFISHDLPVTQHLCDTVAVFHLGKIVESGPSSEVFRTPAHPYTAALVSAAPAELSADRPVRERIVLEGEQPSPVNPPSGCRFRTRCFRATEECAVTEPPLVEISSGHRVACYHPILSDLFQASDSQAVPSDRQVVLSGNQAVSSDSQTER
jgi:oligopeptide/dipeptide ABC transporter, ATP-binding protein, C-terminal domain